MAVRRYRIPQPVFGRVPIPLVLPWQVVRRGASPRLRSNPTESEDARSTGRQFSCFFVSLLPNCFFFISFEVHDSSLLCLPMLTNDSFLVLLCWRLSLLVCFGVSFRFPSTHALFLFGYQWVCRLKLLGNRKEHDVFRILKFVKMEIFFDFIACCIVFFVNFAVAIELTEKKTWKEDHEEKIFQNGKLFRKYPPKSFPKPKPQWK